MREPGDILLVSTYELGHAPHALALAAAFLERAGFRPRCLDAAVEPFAPSAVGRAKLVAFSVPMHTALRLAGPLAERARRTHPDVQLCFFGLYAPLNAERLLALGADAILGGEHEADLVALAEALERGESTRQFVQRSPKEASIRKLDFPVPSRGGLPLLAQYAKMADAEGRAHLAGYTEASRGCLHLCRHCPSLRSTVAASSWSPRRPWSPTLVNRLRPAPPTSPSVIPLLNGPGHALRVARAVHARWPALTFDFTAKVEHLLEHAALLPELAAAGARFVTSAVESLADRVSSGSTRGTPRRRAPRF